MRTIKGPGIFLAQFIGGQSPFNTGRAGAVGSGSGLQSHTDAV